MANAIVAGAKPGKQKPVEAEVVLSDVEGSRTKEELLAFAKEIVESEKPAMILDEQVNQIGQERNYGKMTKVMEIRTEKFDKDGEPTGKFHTCVRVDH